MSNSNGYLVLDIETVSEGWQAPPDQPDLFPPAWSWHILCIGCCLISFDGQPQRLGCIQADGERDLLGSLSGYLTAETPILVTFNGRKFDLPVIALRSFRHGVPLPWYYEERYGPRYRYGQRHLDLFDQLGDFGAVSSNGNMDVLARSIGLPGKGSMDGTQVDCFYKAGRLTEIQEYCLRDVAQTTIIFLRFQLLRGLITLDQYENGKLIILRMKIGNQTVSEILFPNFVPVVFP